MISGSRSKASTSGAAELRACLERDLERGSADLPVLPRAAEKALRLAQRPHVDYDEVTAVAESDPPLAARFLGVANSALYYRGVPIRSIKSAIVRLGAQATRDVLFMAVYSSTVFDVPGYRDVVQHIFRHSVATARIARRIAKLAQLEPELCFLAGLLHDVGRARCLKLATRYRRLGVERREVLSIADDLHARAGATLATAWNLPDDIARCCEMHHDPGEERLPLCVAAADRLSHAFGGERDEEAELTSAGTYLARLGLPPDGVSEVVRLAREEAALVGRSGF